MGFRKTYAADRSDIIWTPEHRAQLCAAAPLWVARLLTAACETGLRPADLIRLSRTHIEKTPKGRRIRLRTDKRRRIATLPVTPAMAGVIDTTPPERSLILTSARGKPLTPHRASEGLRHWRDKAGLTPAALGHALRLQDCRGTAATRLLEAGLSLGDIAAHMGWSLRHAANVIERYALVPHDQTDAVLEKLTRQSLR